MEHAKKDNTCEQKAASGARCCVYIMRHAQTYGNSSGILNGILRDPGLTKKGLKQAKHAAREFMIKPKIILCSPQKRAIQTALQIAKKTGARIKIIKLLHEQDSGDWTGKKVSALQKKYPEKFIRYKGKMTRIFESCPNGETITQIQKRLRKVISLIRKKHMERPILIVAHGVVIRVLLYELGISKTIGGAMATKVPNCSIQRVAI